MKVLLIQPAYREKQYLQYEEIPLQYTVLLKQYSNVAIAKEGWKLNSMGTIYSPTLPI